MTVNVVTENAGTIGVLMDKHRVHHQDIRVVKNVSPRWRRETGNFEVVVGTSVSLVGVGTEVMMPSSNGHLVEMEQWSGMVRAVALHNECSDAIMIFFPADEFLLHMPYHHGLGILKRLVRP
ncbi:hypothetical protein J6590_015262 [Homalodisca vitripennis]|nr:hypothetical protein J6590_015262 [Homalodisca vitripennis]